MDHGRRVDLELDPLNLVPGDIIFLQVQLVPWHMVLWHPREDHHG